MELLWNGNFTGSGSITVNGLSNWGIVAFTNTDDDTYMFIGNPKRGGLLYGSYESASISTGAYRFDMNGDTLTVNAQNRGLYFENTTTYSNGANCRIRKIYGIVKKP